MQRIRLRERAVGLEEGLDGAERGEVLQDREERGRAVDHDAGGQARGLVCVVTVAEPLEETRRQPEPVGERGREASLAMVEEERGQGEKEGGEKDRVGRFAEKGKNGDGWELRVRAEWRRDLLGGVEHAFVEAENKDDEWIERLGNALEENAILGVERGRHHHHFDGR